MDTRAEARHVEDPGCLESLNRAPQSDRSSGDRAWLASTDSCATFVGLESSLIFASLREAQLRTSPEVPAAASC